MIIIKLCLYVLYNKNNTVLAISEDKSLIQRFILQIELFDGTVEKVTSEKKFNKYMIHYSHYLLTEFEGFAIREKEMLYVSDIINTTKYQMKDTLRCLSNINDDCIMSFDEHTILTEAISLLKKHTKNKNINDFINIRAFIRQLYSSNDLQSTIDELTNNFYRHLIDDDY